MKYFIQTNYNDFPALKENCCSFISSLEKLNIPWTPISVMDDQVIGYDGKGFIYGSTGITDLIDTPYYKDQWFNPRNWVGKRNDLLNEKVIASTIGELRKNWIIEPKFIKSIENKVLTGMVLEGIDKDWWYDEYSLLNDIEIVMSPVQDIEREWRFFVINDEIVTGSQYKHDGVKRIRESIPNEVWFEAGHMLDQWMPSRNIVMDICRLRSGEYKVVEWNCINTSGFYNCEINCIIDALK